MFPNIQAALDWVTEFDASIGGLGGCPFMKAVEAIYLLMTW